MDGVGQIAKLGKAKQRVAEKELAAATWPRLRHRARRGCATVAVGCRSDDAIRHPAHRVGLQPSQRQILFGEQSSSVQGVLPGTRRLLAMAKLPVARRPGKPAPSPPVADSARRKTPARRPRSRVRRGNPSQTVMAMPMVSQIAVTHKSRAVSLALEKKFYWCPVAPTYIS